MQRYTRIPADYGEEDGRAFIGGAPGRRARGESLELAVAGRGDGRLLGAIGLVDRPPRRPRGRRSATGSRPGRAAPGVAARALDPALAAGRCGPLGLERLDLYAAVSNVASLRVAERCGFVREGTLRKAWFRGPAREDMAVFSLLPAGHARG